MAASREFIDFITEQMAGLGPVTVKRMFSGAGFFRDGLMFALIAGDAFYFKTDDAGSAAFASEGLAPFSYKTKYGIHTLTSYWRAPERCLDDPDEMRAWSMRAFDVALAKSAAKPKKTPSSKKR